MNLEKPDTTTTQGENAGLSISKTPAATKITVNVGFPGNIKKVTLEGTKQFTVGDALAAAQFDAKGYEIRMGGEPVQANAPVVDGRTILLLRPVRGNVNLEKPETETAQGENAGLSISKTPAANKITVNVGFPGNIKKVTLEGTKQFTVGDALAAAQFDSAGYEIRMGGEPVQANAPVVDGRTILLLRPVRGNK